MVGPASKRVLISQSWNPDTEASDIPGIAYSESVLSVDEATGKTIADSELGPSTALGSLINVGYGGRRYGQHGYEVVPG